MNAAKSFLTAAALAAGLALPFFAAAQLSNNALEAEAVERVERGLEQLNSDSTVVRELGLSSLMKEGESALPMLKEKADAAKQAGQLDLEMRIRDVISRIESENKQPSSSDNPQSNRSGSRIVIQPGSGSVKSTTWIENGKVTSIQQDSDGKITLKITEDGNETVQTFDTEQAFRDAQPELAKRFAGNNGFSFRFSGPWGEGGVNEAELDLPDPFELFRGRGAQPTENQELAQLKERVAELRGLAEGLGESGAAVQKKVAEIDEAIKRLEESLPQTPRIQRAFQMPRDPFEEMNRMMEEARKRQEEALRRFREGNGNPFERFRFPAPAPQPAPEGKEPEQEPAPAPKPDQPFPEKKPGASSDF